MKVALKTNLGTILVELYEKEAPETVRNFLHYVDTGFYDGTIFHRVIPDFMVQGGGFDRSFTQKPTEPPIRNEADNQLPNRRGTLAMARTGVVDSATCQFFINLTDNDFLNFRAPTQEHFGYCVFGRVLSGMDVADKMALVKTGRRGMYRDVPQEEIVILEARRAE